MSTVIFPYAYIPDPTKGKPISNGQLFFGLPDLDPEIEANKITIGIQTTKLNFSLWNVIYFTKSLFSHVRPPIGT